MPRSSAVYRSLSRLSTITLCLLIFSMLSFAAAADRISGPIVAGETVKLGGGIPLQARAAKDEGPVDPAFQLSYITLLTVPSAAQQKELNTLYLDQLNPKSASYRKWLTPEQYADRFGLSAGDMNKITTWLQAQGFGVERTARGRDFVVFSGTAAQVEKAFQTQIHSFVLNGETHFANTTPPAIPAALSGIVTGFHGLNNFRPKSQAKRGDPSYTYVNKGDFYFLAPGDITAMYDAGPLQTTLDGTGQSIAVMGQTGIYQSDLTNFRQNFGLSAISCTVSSDIISACSTSNFKYVLVNGAYNTIYANDLPEADLDVEWSGAAAPKAKVIFVTATDQTGFGVWDSWYFAVDNAVAPVITMSYTAPCELAEASFGTSGEGTFPSDEAELKKANVQGITFLNSSGDSGAAECDYGSNFSIYGYAVGYPASSQYVTGVGGTSIPQISPNEYSSTYWNASNGTGGASAKGYIPEQPWNDAQEFGLICVADPSDSFCSSNSITDWSSAQAATGISSGGGGISNCVTIDANGVCTAGFPQPSWQSGISASSVNPNGFGAVNSTPTRYTPDISLLASPNFPGYLICTQSAALGGTGTGSTCDSPSTGITDMLNACFAGTEPCSIFGGTSVSTPVFAGMVALLNQYLAVSGGLGNINPTLYSLAKTTPTAFHTVTTGSTGSYSNGAWCQAGTPDSGFPSDPWPAALQCPSSGFLGFNSYDADPTINYNLVTGLGSVDLDKLAVAWATSLEASFTLAASPTSVSIAQGGSGTSTITVTAVNGFTGNVTLAASGLPSGVTAAFSPNPTGTTSTLTLTATGSATAGTATVTITGTSGSLTAMTTVSLTVTAGPSFSLSAAPGSVSVAQSSSNTTKITVTDAGGFSGNVTLAASGLPSGVTAGFSPNPTGTTSTLTLTASATATTGTVTVTVTGTSGSLTANTSISLTVTPPPNFTLTANPTSLTITPGGTGGSNSATSTITVVPSNGFTGSVTLTASGLPTGVTAAFGTNPTTGTSVVTLTASATATAGPATVTIKGTSGSLAAETATIAVTVNQNFTLTTPSTPPAVLSGESTTSTFKVTANSGGTFTSAVTFNCNNLPDATVTCGFSTVAAGATSPATVTLTINTTGPNTAGGVKNNRRRADNRSPWLPLTLPLAGIVFAGFAGRKASKYGMIVALCATLMLIGVLVACGSSSTPPVSVSVTPSAATLFPNDTADSWPNQTATFTADIMNSTQGVTWAVTPANGGSITSGGVYTAPTIAVGLPASATVTATSQSDATKTASATVTITPSTVPTSIVGAPYSLTVTATEGPVSNTSSALALTVN